MNKIVNVYKRFRSTQLLNDVLGKNEFPVFISSLSGAAKSLSIIDTFNTNSIVVLFPDVKSASEFCVELNALKADENIIEISDFTKESIQEKLTQISNADKVCIVSTYAILNLVLPPKDNLKKETLVIDSESAPTYDNLIAYLYDINYTKEKFVEAPGDYSVRGSIIDFWSFSEKNPIRLEYDGDFLESLRYFDPENQRSTQIVRTVTLASSIETLNGNNENTTNIFDYVNDPLIFSSYYELLNYEKENLNIFKEEEKAEEIVEEISEDEFPEPEVAAEEAKPIKHKEGLTLPYSGKWIIEDELNLTGRTVKLDYYPSPQINSDYKVLLKTLTDYLEKDYTIFISAENDLQTSRLKELMIELNEEFDSYLDEGKIRFEVLLIKEGFLNPHEKFLLFSDYQVFNKPFRTRVAHKKKRKTKSQSLSSIKKGDYVVHENYGIAKYAGLENIKIGDTEQESMKLLYAEGGVVYVNLNYIHLVKKYSSNENLTPTLSTLGSNTWKNTKQKAKKKIKEAARELIELYAKRKSSRGYSFSPDTVWQKELEASFFYEDTPDQYKVTVEIKEDMESASPMDRLVCGDVGFGKTEIAIRAAFKSVQDGKQAAILVPTTILAEQHYNTFQDRLSQFPVKVAALSRFQSKKEQKEIVQELAEGKVDIIIGTHRLISKDIKFKDLGVLIIDEEHRFGVSAKEKLRAIKINVDTLTLTATPIPRTLNLSLLGARDLSIISTPPPNRQPIYNQVAVWDMRKIKEWIQTELDRNGQVYFVHDRVHSIDKLKAYLAKYMPTLRVAIAHGQMKPDDLENVIHDFMNKKFDVLLSTKIIESGIDIPNVNTIIINRADRFGLAELHQLRGRVGRSNRQAFAYFIVPSMSSINKKALRRLQAIEEYTDIGAGFHLAMRDLEIRGAGNLLGTEQSGFINDVGFDLYIKMINEAVEELKYQEFSELFKELPKPKDRTEPTIDAYFEIGISDNYMPDQMDRLNFYTGLYQAKTIADIDELKEELSDRFGEIPIITRRLIASAIIRLYASYALFQRIIIQRKNISIILPKSDHEDFYKFRFIELMRYIMDNYKDRIKLEQTKESMKLVLINNFDKPEGMLDFVTRFCREITVLFNNEIPVVAEQEIMF